MPTLRTAALGALVLSACASAPPLSPDLRRAAANIEMLESSHLANQPYVLLGEIEGISCGRQLGADPSLEIARDQLRVAAARKGAVAVVDVICQEQQVDWTNNCWKTLRCVGDAVRFPTAAEAAAYAAPPPAP